MQTARVAFTLSSRPARVVLDANVLFSEPLRSLLLAAATSGLIQPHWSEQILRETCRSLVRTGRATDVQVQALRDQLLHAFPAALVSGHEALIPALGNHPADRHVAAAAQHAGVPVIVTRNLHDFRKLPAGLTAVSPDKFLIALFERDAGALEGVLRLHAAAAGGLAPLLSELAKIVPHFAKTARQALMVA